MAIAHTKSIICLDDFARYFGIHPVQFNCLSLVNCPGFIGQQQETCDDFWFQYPWQTNKLVSIEEVATGLALAEAEIEAFLGTPICPRWVCENVAIPDHYKIDHKWASHVWVEDMAFQLKWGCVCQFGQPTFDLLSTPALVYADSEGDGFFESASFVYNVPVGVDPNDIEFWHVGGEIGPICSSDIVRSFNATTNDWTVTIPSWLLVKPEKYYQHNFTFDIRVLEACDSDNYVDEIELRHVTKSDCLPEAIVEAPELSCECHCDNTEIPACLRALNKDDTLVRLKLGQYGEGENADCYEATCCPTLCNVGRPTSIKVFYQAGCHRYQSEFKEAAMILAATRLPQSLCTCGCIQNRIQRWQKEASIQTDGSGVTSAFIIQDLDNPFGTRYGEIEVYKRLMALQNQLC